MMLEDKLFFSIKKQTQMVHSRDNVFLILFFLNIKRKTCERREAWSREPLHLVKKVLKITESES